MRPLRLRARIGTEGPRTPPLGGGGGGATSSPCPLRIDEAMHVLLCYLIHHQPNHAESSSGVVLPKHELFGTSQMNYSFETPRLSVAAPRGEVDLQPGVVRVRPRGRLRPKRACIMIVLFV